MAKTAKPIDAEDPIERLVDEGRVGELLAYMRENRGSFGLDRQIYLLRRALAAAARDPGRHVQELYRLMLGISGDLLVMAQMPLLRRLDQVGQDVMQHDDSFVRNEIEKMLPTVERIQGHIVGLTKALGTVCNTMNLRLQPAAGDAPVLRLVRDTEDMMEHIERELPRVAHG